MQKTVYNSAKGRLETIDICFTNKNTTWFENLDDDTGVSLITDFEGGLLIASNNYDYPILIYDVARSDIKHDRQKAQELKRIHTDG
jgi:hypothetical protein